MAPLSEQNDNNGMIKEPWCSSYPSDRDILMKSSKAWLQGKAKDDQIDGPYWRIHNKLYDLTRFANIHPGGRDWINYTKGTDITEAFETSHLSSTPEALLKAYFVKNIDTPRNSPYTFEEDGFYKTLKRRVCPIIEEIGSGPTLVMERMTDGVVLLFFIFMILGSIHNSLLLISAAGVTLSFAMTMAHNFFHQRDNSRMFYFDLSLYSSSDWRISHALSHHLFTNTLMDYEVTFTEPFLYFLPYHNKFKLIRYASVVHNFFIYFIIFYLEFIKKMINIARGHNTFEYRSTLPFIEMIIMGLCTSSFGNGIYLWFIMQSCCSFVFNFLGLMAAHHHPDIYHAGDRFRSNPDWGLCQLDAVRDRKEVTGCLFLVAILFGDHTLHHLFPTVDHSKLPHLYTVFRETCKEFDINFEFFSLKDMLFGKYAQLVRLTPNNNSPGYHEKSL